MRHTNKFRRFTVSASRWMAASVVLVAAAFAQDRGSIVVTTVPDSAVVVLDNAKEAERQRTPFTNESMIPGIHTVLLRPNDPAYKSAVYDVEIVAGQAASLDHVFEYRTKAYGMEALSLAPWKVGIQAGFEFRRYIGFESEKKTDKSAVAKPSTYAPDSIPNSIAIPIELRLGFPGGWEAHFSLPVASKADPKIKSDSVESFSLSDPGFGVKWVYAPLNSGLDLTWRFGSSLKQNMGAQADALIVTALTNQKWQMVDVAANLGVAIRMTSLVDPGVERGNQIFAKARGGLLLADRFMPLVQAGFQYTLADLKTKNDSALGKDNFQLTLTPGFIWYAGRNFSLELGVPLTLVASNEETSWGAHVSAAFDFSLQSKSKTTTTRKTAALSAYPLQADGVPGSSPSNVLFDGKEVSNAEYKDFCDKTGREYPADPEFTGMPGYFTDPKYGGYPVVKISIDDARAYAAWVGKRLPTVTEWRKEIESATLNGNMLACGLETPELVGSRHQGSGLYNFVGNVAEWVENDRKVGSVAYIAGGFFSLPRERCLDKGRWVDVASPAGAKYIGMRLVTEVK